MTTPWPPWPVDQVLALAPDPAAATTARAAARPSSWDGTGADAGALWGRFRGAGRGEPYLVTIDLDGPAWRCTCPSRKVPCKHVLGLLLQWSAGQVPAGARPPAVAAWLAHRAEQAAARDAREHRAGAGAGARPSPPSPPSPLAARPSTTSGEPGRPPSGQRAGSPPRPDDRSSLVAAGLAELDRWLADVLRRGLADPAWARLDAWDGVAARLVDAKAGSLANRVRRVAAQVGAGDGWHERVLGEIGALHLLAAAGRRAAGEGPPLPDDLRDSVRQLVGWNVRKDDVLASPPVTDRWAVLGRSDTREDRIVVRRTWLRADVTGRWALVLSFAAYGEALDASLPPGTAVHADVHFFPGVAPVRALVGVRHAPDERCAGPPRRAVSIAEACAEVGWAWAAEPWLERWPVTVLAVPARAGAGWCLTDATGSFPLVETAGLATLLACSGGRPVPVTAEATPEALTPLAVHLADRTVPL